MKQFDFVLGTDCSLKYEDFFFALPPIWLVFIINEIKGQQRQDKKSVATSTGKSERTATFKPWCYLPQDFRKPLEAASGSLK